LIKAIGKGGYIMQNYQSPSIQLVGGSGSSANAVSLIKMGYAVLAVAGAALIAGAVAAVVYGAAWVWCDPYW